MHLAEFKIHNFRAFSGVDPIRYVLLTHNQE